MYENHSVAVVVPAHNEAEHVGDVLDDVPSFVDRIYVVDDCSTDDTWAEVRRCMTAAAPAEELSGPTTPQAADGGRVTDGRIVAVRHEENRGAGGALRTGYRHAPADGMDVTVAMDADGQMDPAAMPPLLDPVVAGDAGYAKGNRLRDGGARGEMPPLRLVGNWLLSLLTKVASGYWGMSDPQNGYTAISHEALEAVDLGAMRAGHDYTNDLLVRLNVAEVRLADVPIPARYGDEESSIDFARFVRTTSLTLLRGFVWRLRRSYLTRGFHPLVLAYGASALAGTLGLASAADAVRRRRGAGTDGGASALAALVSLASGALFAVWGMLLDVRENEDLEVDRE